MAAVKSAQVNPSDRFPHSRMVILDDAGTLYLWQPNLPSNNPTSFATSADTNNDTTAPKKIVDCEIIPPDDSQPQPRVLAISSAGVLWQYLLDNQDGAAPTAKLVANGTLS